MITTASAGRRGSGVGPVAGVSSALGRELSLSMMVWSLTPLPFLPLSILRLEGVGREQSELPSIGCGRRFALSY
jgi:hypothetical protein